MGFCNGLWLSFVICLLAWIFATSMFQQAGLYGLLCSMFPFCILYADCSHGTSLVVRVFEAVLGHKLRQCVL